MVTVLLLVLTGLGVGLLVAALCMEWRLQRAR